VAEQTRRLSTGINQFSSFHIRCITLDLLEKGFRASNSKRRQIEASHSKSSTSFNQNISIPSLAGIEDTAFSTWIEYHYRWALTHCEIRTEEDFVYLVRVGTILGPQSLLDE
jgi:hypothetical protein